jgi:hypothetical protein
MSYSCCPKCELRFSKAASVYLIECPQCGRKPVAIESLKQVVGFQLINLQLPAPDVDGVAVAISLPLPGAPGPRA